MLGGMPDPYERHARGGEYYDDQSSRSEQRRRAAAEALAKRPPGKKDPALCKAAHWKGPHKPEFRIRESGWRRSTGCGWGPSWRDPGKVTWHCKHDELCSGCGKVLRTRIPDEECPDYHPLTLAELDAIEAKLAEERKRISAARIRSQWQPKPPVTGPQGYRRRRPD